MTSPRLIAIGDIHGCSLALAALLKQIAPRPEDTIVTLGDYMDCGPDSKGVLDQLIELSGRRKLIPLQGNHEEMVLGALLGRPGYQFWLEMGDGETLGSYGNTGELDLVPPEHIQFLERCRDYYETETHFFLHANYFPNRPLAEQDNNARLWMPLSGNEIPGPHFSGKTAILGHTPQPNGKILDLGFLKCIDTGCGYGGLLTAMDIQTGTMWRVDEQGYLAT